MTAFSQNLEAALHRARETATTRRHEYATLEHLLLALLDDRDVADVMRACKSDLGLRQRLSEYLDNELASLVVEDSSEAQPTTGFQRVIHRAVVHVQSSGREEVTGAHVLLAMFAERESHAVSLLQAHGLTRFDAQQYMAHGIRKSARAPDELSMERSVNFKHACPECGALAWAASDIKLICGVCHRHMKRREH